MKLLDAELRRFAARRLVRLLVVAALALTAVVNGFQIVRASRDVVYHVGAGTSIPAECVVGSHDGLRVLDPKGDVVGKVRDVVVQLLDGVREPRVHGLVTEVAARHRVFIPMTRVTSIDAGAVEDEAARILGGVAVRATEATRDRAAQ